MKKKPIIKKILLGFLILFILFNSLAFIQAYRFTHYSLDSDVKTEAGGGALSTLKILITGIDNPRPENKEEPRLDYETIYIESNVNLECWTINSVESKATVILFHGYAGAKIDMLERAYQLYKMGYNAVLVDFMGSGGSGGNITTIGYKEAENVKDVYEYVKSKGEKNIVLLGTSMGAAAILKSINDYELSPRAIILECPYASMLETISIRCQIMGIPSFPTAQILAFWGGVQHGFNAFSMKPSEYAKQVDMPTLLIYGEKDNRVGKQETQRIYNNLNGVKTLKIFTESGHADYLEKEKSRWIGDVELFFDNVFMSK